MKKTLAAIALCLPMAAQASPMNEAERQTYYIEWCSKAAERAIELPENQPARAQILSLMLGLGLSGDVQSIRDAADVVMLKQLQVNCLAGIIASATIL